MSGKSYKGAVCRGSLLLGTACGACERCEEERARYANSPELTPEQRRQLIGGSAGNVGEEIPPKAPIVGATAPMQLGALDDYQRENVGFVAQQESLNDYLLEDGTIIRAKLVLMGVDRLVGAYNPDGTQVYLTAFQQLLHMVPGKGTRREE